jgi:hypothetical protein
MPAEYKWVEGTTKHTSKDNLKQDTANYIMQYSEMMACDNMYLVLLVDGRDITLNIAEK